MEQLTILKHATNRLAKRWNSDGTVSPYDDAKYFIKKNASATNIEELSGKLTTLEAMPGACLIRGQYIGDEAAELADPEYKAGKVRRVLAVFEDRPLHTCLVEVDNFEPIMGDPVHDPEDCIEEYITTMLPDCFHGVSFHWQLSNSAGAPGKEHLLKVHIWFWLATPYTSAQLRAWSKTLAPDTLDASVMNPVQIHYTSAPVFAEGVHDPVPVRSGFVEGLLDDEAALVIDEAAIAQAAAQDGKVTRQATLRSAIDDDPIVHLLHDKGMVKSTGTAGQLFIDCPCADKHTGDGGPTSSLYYPPNTGGYQRGAFVCLHDHCRETPQHVFQAALGYDPILDEFTDLGDGGAGGDIPEQLDRDGEGLYEAIDESTLTLLGEGSTRLNDSSIAMKDIPEAKHLTTDLSNAERIMRKFKTRLIVSADRWFAWTGTHWAQDDGEVYVSAVKLSRIIHAEADNHEAKALAICKHRIGGDLTIKWLKLQMDDKKLLKELPGKAVGEMLIAGALKKWAARSEMRSSIDAALYLAKKMLAIPSDRLDSDPWALNCANGTIDLRTGKLRRHRPSDYITHCAPLAYDPNAAAPVWDRVVPQITLEQDKEETPVADFLQRWFGYCATGSTREQAFLVHYGNGSNGKSTIIDAVAEVLNGYAGTAAPSLLVASKNESHPTEIADLFGKRMVTAHESDDGAMLREGFIKQATGSDKLKARYMRADFFEFLPTHKLQLLTNHKPIIKSQDDGIWRRVLLMPYLARFGDAGEVKCGIATALKDMKVEETLRGERPGILNWIVRGAVSWYQEGLNAPDAVKSASREYQSEQDRIKQFITECCEVGNSAEHVVPLAGVFGGIYPAYQEWCKEGGIRSLAKNRMLQEVQRVVPASATRSIKRKDEFGATRRIMQVEGIKLLGED